jgi:iron complex outermembrane receptor protein
LQAEYQGVHLDAQFEIVQPAQTTHLGTLLAAPVSPETPSVQTGGTAAQADELPGVVRGSVTVTARRVEEEAQDVPIPVSIIDAKTIQSTGAFNVNRIKELIPSVQMYSSNPRNTAVTIRGLGSPFGLTNDGIDPGLGFYVDGVYYARSAAATLDFIDLEQVEVLRGPQGTLFGKNTTSGAINITTRRPTFTPETNFELNFGNYGFVQAQGSVSGPLLKDRIAGRISFAGTQRNGFLKNIRTGDDVNDLNNLGMRSQFLILPCPGLTILLSADVTFQRPHGYAQVIAGVAPTLRPANRQWPAIAADLGYRPPSYNAFDRLTDTDTPWRANQDMGGGSIKVDWTRGSKTLTSITAWRFWNWDPSNDRDFTGLPITTISAAPSKQKQFSQELRYTGRFTNKTAFLIGFFTFQQNLQPDGSHRQEHGSAAARTLLAPSADANTPGLLEGYGQNIYFDLHNASTAFFGQLEYKLTDSLLIIPGLRYNHDVKKIDYDQTVYGGLPTTDVALRALQRSVLSPVAYKVDAGDHNVSGALTVSYKASATSNLFVTYSTSFKPIGLNLGGVPTDAAASPVLSAATVRPERVGHWEVGLKTKPIPRLTANLALFQSNVRDYQMQVVNAQVGVLRGYLANAERVRVRGIELDSSLKVNPQLNVYASVAFTDGRYLRFKDAPPPLELTGGTPVVDASGSVLPGISKWAFSVGAEYTKLGSFLSLKGEYFARMDASYRSGFSSNPTPSRYLNVPQYALFNPRVGFRTRDGLQVSLWARNLANTNYFEFLSPQPSNTGLYVGQPGDPRTFGVTIARSFSF